MTPSQTETDVKELLEIEGYCDEFEERLQSGANLAVDDYLGTLPTRLRSRIRPLLHEIWTQRPSADDRPTLPSASFDGDGSALQPGQLIAERYHLITAVGRGGTAVVWKATDTQTDLTVAVKMAHTSTNNTKERFRREYEASSRMAHPGIPGSTEFGLHGDRPYIVCDYVDGGSIADRISSNNLTILESVRCVRGVCEIVEAAHEQGIIHRDLKPQNILVNRDGRVFVTDFGLALASDSNHDSLTLTGDIIGTLAYMAPEQALGNGKHADERTDVYGIGMILYQLLTGEIPFRGSAQHVLFQVMQTDPPGVSYLAPHIPKSLDLVARKCLEKLPQHRFQNVRCVREELDRFLAGSPLQVKPAGVLTRTSKWAAKNQRLALAIGIATALLFVSTFVSLSAALLLNKAYADESVARKAAEEARNRMQQALEQSQRSYEATANANKAALAAADAAQSELLASHQVERILVSLFEANDPIASAASSGSLPPSWNAQNGSGSKPEGELERVLQRGVHQVSADKSLNVATKTRLLDVLANISRELLKFEQSQDLLDQSSALRAAYPHEFESPFNHAYTLRHSLYQANLFRDRGDIAKARAVYQHVEDAAQDLGDEFAWLKADALMLRGHLELMEHATPVGQDKLRESLVIREDLRGDDILELLSQLMLTASNQLAHPIAVPEDSQFVWVRGIYDTYKLSADQAVEKRYAESIANYRRFLDTLEFQLGGNNRWLLLAQGEFAGRLFDAGNYAEAYSLITQLLEGTQDEIPSNPHIRDAQLKLANELLRAEQPAKALAYFKRLQRSVPDGETLSDDVHLGLIWSLFATGQPEQAIPSCQHLFSKRGSISAEQSAWYAYTHARVLVVTGHEDKAERVDRIALNDANSITSVEWVGAAWLERLAVVYAHNKQLDKAVSLLRLAIEKETRKRFAGHPRVARYQASLATNLAKIGHNQEAIEVLEQVQSVWLSRLPTDDPRIESTRKSIDSLKARLAPR